MPSVSADEDYQAQQQRLREQSGLDDGDGDTDLPELQIPEVNPEIYKDVEPILFRGFVTATAVINEVPFVFKSLNHHEFQWLALTQNVERSRPTSIQRYHNMFLAYGVALAGGLNVLKDRDDKLSDLADFFGSLPKAAQNRVVRHLSEINRRANRAAMLVEPYVMENASRLRWVQVKGLDLSTTAVTGFEGSQTLGLNWGQLTWRALNHLEDLKENAEREWENAKFVASSMAGKGMQRIYSADKRRRQDAKTEQVERREKIIRLALLNEPLEDQKPTGNVVVARTVAELTNQLENDLKGEKDWHDRVIEEHENRARADMHERSRAIHEARAAHIREFGDRPIVATTISGLTRAEVQQRLSERKSELARSLASKAQPSEHSDPKYAEFSQKWLQQPIVRNTPSVMPTDSRPRSRATPFRRDS
jgi:hypothetical protein